MRILRNLLGQEGGGAAGGVAASAGGGSGNDWTTSIPEDIRPLVQAKGWKSPADVVTSYREAEKLLGANRLPSPQPTWKDEDWGKLFGAIGRPETPDKYGLPDVKLPDGAPTIDENILKEVRAEFHGLGLTDKQFKGVMARYLNTLGKSHEALTQERNNQVAQAEQALKAEWKDGYQANLDIAKSVIRKFATPEDATRLAETGWGNDPQMIRMLHNIGKGMLEDTGSGKGSTLVVTNQASAVAEIERLKSGGEPDFLAALYDKTNAGHKLALQRWNTLHQTAYPNKEAA